MLRLPAFQLHELALICYEYSHLAAAAPLLVSPDLAARQAIAAPVTFSET